MSNIKKNISNERGQVVIIVALLLVCLFGMTALVVDVGSIYEERRQAQTVADAAALAGAQDLPEHPGQAIQTAIDYADLNGVSISEDNIQIYKTEVPDDTITVTPTDINATLFFARVLGVNSVTVNATATATANSPLSMTGLMPWTVALEDYGGELDSGVSYDMKVGSDSHLTPGFFQAMRFDDGEHGEGANQYRRNIINGCKQEIFIDQLYPVEPGNMAIPTEDGVISKLGGDTCSFDDVVEFKDGKYYGKDGNCPRIVYIPLIEKRPENPSDDVKVVGFAIFFIEGVWLEHGGKPETTVTGRFIDNMIATSSGGVTGYSGGIKIIRLVK